MKNIQLIKKKKETLRNRNIKNIIYLLVASIFIFSCSTKKNTFVTRSFHNITSKYNIYFNANESYNEGISKYKESHKDDYSRILPILIFPNKATSSSIQPQMDRVIEKCSKVIRNHSITVKPSLGDGKFSEKEKAFYKKSEYNKYIDDSYLLIGKAQFHKLDFSSAIQTFEYIIKEYNLEDSKYEAYMWLAISYFQKNEYRETQTIFKKLQTDENFPDEFSYLLSTSIANIYIRQQQLREALPYVEQSLELSRKKTEKLRLLFILAQINDELNNKTKASDYYTRVIKKNPPYEMTFNAKIKLASLYSGDNGNDIKEQLIDMLKDEKNLDYLDQIYYALGKIAQNDNKEKIALKNYKLSAINSISNDNQKGLAYLAVADIYFKNSKYTPAQAYYDSTINSLDVSYPGYAKLLIKNNNLSKLVENIKEAEFQDSIQRIAKMSKNERNIFIDKIISDVKKQEKQKRAEKTSGNTSRFNQSSNTYRTNYGDNGKWYFYSQNAKSFGEPDFQRKWGKRKLEDNWRRKNKRDLSIVSIDETETTKTEINNKTGLSTKSREYYMVDIPLTDSLLKISNKKMEKALFKVGEVYMNNLKNDEEAINALLILDKEFPKGKYNLPSYYYLYTLYQKTNNTSLAEKYKNYILNNYPDSKYTMVLSNPNFYKELEDKENEKENYYNKTYNFYKANNYINVINNCTNATKKYKNTKLLSKFSFLNALASGKLYGITELKKKLNEVIDKYPKTETGIRAKELFASIEKNELNPILAKTNIQNTDEGNRQDTTKKKIKTNIPKQKKDKENIYKINKDKKQFNFVLLIDKNVDVNMLKFKLINFNIDYFLQEDYSTENKSFNKYFEIISIKTLKNIDEANEYYEIFYAKENSVLEGFKEVNYQYFIISIDNYITLLKEKSVREYLIFFKENFLNKNTSAKNKTATN